MAPELYGTSGSKHDEYIPNIMLVLRELADLARAFSPKFLLQLSQQQWQISRTSATLHLFYHQVCVLWKTINICATILKRFKAVILAGRPLFFHLVSKIVTHISSNDMPNPQVSPALVSLIKTCVDSAETSLRILSVLKRHSSLQKFLFADLEATFSSAIVLLLATLVLPDLWTDLTGLDIAPVILQELASNGNCPAERRYHQFKELMEVSKVVSTARADRSRQEDVRQARSHLNSSISTSTFQVAGPSQNEDRADPSGASRTDSIPPIGEQFQSIDQIWNDLAPLQSDRPADLLYTAEMFGSRMTMEDLGDLFDTNNLEAVFEL